jgi:hypothetical protein
MRFPPLAALLLALAAPAAGQARFAPVAAAEDCPADRAPILILGTYHMSNPGLDAHNIEADDVLSPRRQREIEALVAALARFRPTKVMVEAAASSPVTQQRYEQYLAGAHALSRNETEQVGYRLARAAGLGSVIPIDFRMMMSGLTYDEVELRPRAPAGSGPEAREPSAEELLLRRSSVAEYLIRMNRPERWLADHLGYMSLFEPEADNPAIYQRADFYTNWHKRNFRMWANVVRRTERPGDRVFLMVGAGHLAILRGLAQDMPGFCLVEPDGYLRAALATGSQ